MGDIALFILLVVGFLLFIEVLDSGGGPDDDDLGDF